MVLGICYLLAVSLNQLPPYYRAAALKLRGDYFSEHGQRERAVEAFTNSLQLAPSSSGVRIGLAIAYFQSPSDADHKKALKVLGGLTIEKRDWEKLTAVMPKDYLHFFNDVKE
jgi:predicted Zn-dependent protease